MPFHLTASIVVELFNDPLGDARVVIHSPFGGRVNGPWGLALTGALRERLGVDVEVETNDNGILLRLLDTEAEFPLDLMTGLSAVEAQGNYPAGIAQFSGLWFPLPAECGTRTAAAGYWTRESERRIGCSVYARVICCRSCVTLMISPSLQKLTAIACRM